MLHHDWSTSKGGAEDPTTGIAAPRTRATYRDLAPAAPYTLIRSVFNWGSSYDRIVLPTQCDDAAAYTVSVVRCNADGAWIDEGDRTVTAAWLSDAQGIPDDAGRFTTLSMTVGPRLALAQPYYTDPKSFKGELKCWADCAYTVRNERTGEVWNRAGAVLHPDDAGFSTGVFDGASHALTYAWYAPDDDRAHPLLLWLHGAGSGGTDPGFLLGSMRVTHFLSPSVQSKFGGAHVLLPQCPTWWLDDGSPAHVSRDGRSIYTDAVMALLEVYCDRHPNVDLQRIYVGGCSNGGYMTLRLCLDHPEWFAAAFPVCAAFENDWLVDDDIRRLGHMPLWFVHCASDPIVDIRTTSLPIHERLKHAGSEDVHFSLYDEIVDPDCGAHYMGHFAWVYALLDLCRTDIDGRPVTRGGDPVTLYEWCAAHRKRAV